MRNLLYFVSCIEAVWFVSVQMSKDALLGLGPGLKTLTLKGNQLKNLPDLGLLTGLEAIDLRDNPLLCDCDLLPLRRSELYLQILWEILYKIFIQGSINTNLNFKCLNVLFCSLCLLIRWLENVSLEVTATCAQPLELRGQRVRDVHIFMACPENFTPPDEKAIVALRPANLKKSKHSILKFPGEKKTRPEKAKLSRPSKNPRQRNPAAPKKTKKQPETPNMKT